MALFAVYDSGVGGIPVLAALAERLSKEDEIVYLGDNANMPYGEKEKSELLSIAAENLDFLAAFSPQAAVIACNTLSVTLDENFAKRYSFPLVRVLPDWAEIKKLGEEALLLCTPNTARVAEKEGVLQSGARVVAAKTLAAFIEKHFYEMGNVDWKGFLRPQLGEKTRVLFLGCTHYLWLKPHVADLGLYLRGGEERAVDFCVRLSGTHLGSAEKDKPFCAAGKGTREMPSVHFVGACALTNKNAYLHFLQTNVLFS